jgi:hypothetical protein
MAGVFAVQLAAWGWEHLVEGVSMRKERAPFGLTRRPKPGSSSSKRIRSLPVEKNCVRATGVLRSCAMTGCASLIGAWD